MSRPIDDETWVQFAHQLRAYFQQKLFGNPFGMKTVGEALEETDKFFNGSRFVNSSNLFHDIVETSLVNCGMNGSDKASEVFFFSLQENYVLAEVSVFKGKDCSFDDPSVQEGCAVLYLDGERTKRNALRALEWLEKAARQNNIYSLFTLAQLLLDGTEITPNRVRAVQLLEQASALGDGDAPALLAGLYSEGKNVPRDDSRALHLAQLGAERGSPHAQGQLAMFYAQGVVCSRNLMEAGAWMTLAARAGEVTSKANLPIILQAMKQADHSAVETRANELRKLHGLK